MRIYISKGLWVFSFLLVTLHFTSTAGAQAIKPWGEIANATQRFVVLTDFQGDAVLDRSTGLIWDRTPEGSSFSWAGAQRRCVFVGAGGVSPAMGWRLPKAEELYSLMLITGGNQGGPTQALVTGHPFVVAAGTKFWTATTVPQEDNSTDQAYYANSTGNFGTDFKDQGNYGVWCVRGGAN